MELQLFNLILFPSVAELIGTTEPEPVAYTGGLILACKLLAWGLGGIVFGVAADRIGRAKTMMITVSIYSAFTGFSGLAQTWWQLALLQAIAGLGIGGEWAAGAALVAETWPERTRPRALQVMQMCFGLGFLAAALLALAIGPFGWRWVLAAGAFPAALTLFIRRFVPEPVRWVERRRFQPDAAPGETSDVARTLLSIFAPGIRRRTIVGLLAVSAMMIGGWATGALLPIWIHQLVPSDHTTSAEIVTGQSFMLMSIGGLFGYLALIWLTESIGRRWSYFLFVFGSALTTVLLFTGISTLAGLLPFMMVYGFFAVGGFGVFATYLPELFPTHIRATGQGFCWNAARVLTAAGPFVSGFLATAFGSLSKAGVAVAVVYLVGMAAIWFGPETKARPLED
jgi:MFS family permease